MVAVAWLFLVVLDAGEYQVRCRACFWSSPRCRDLPAARRAWIGHDCLLQRRPAC